VLCVYFVLIVFFSVNCVIYVFLQFFDTVGWVFWPVKTVARITYTVLVEMANPAQSINQSWRCFRALECDLCVCHAVTFSHSLATSNSFLHLNKASRLARSCIRGVTKTAMTCMLT